MKCIAKSVSVSTCLVLFVLRMEQNWRRYITVKLGQRVSNCNKTKYKLMPSHETTQQGRGILIVDRSFDEVASFKHMEARVTSQNYFHEEIKSRLNSCNESYHSVRNHCLLVSCTKLKN
jgi:hypothetical protein